MNYRRMKYRGDYCCLKTNRIQAMILVFYEILGPDGEIIETIPARHWQAYRRKIKNRNKLKENFTNEKSEEKIIDQENNQIETE